jgi:site-specific DNA recombinase
MRVALYARYSSDQQRDASIADQIRLCRSFADGKAWTVAQEFSDAAMSGATLLRPGYQGLLHLALRGGVDVVLAESLDRFSRDQEDIAGLFKRLSFVGVQLVTVSEGYIGHLHVGLKGTMNALFLKDLADKTRRGLQGRVEAGKSGGGLCYGYRAVAGAAGDREILPVQATVVERIFRSFADGMSPKAIAKQLNAEGIAGPSGKPWHPSTINGNVSRGTGVLNNELYVGRLIWNRLRYVKDPDTGKRVSRLNPRSAWTTTDVPALRLIDRDLWHAVKARQLRVRRVISETGRLGYAKRPVYLFSGLTRCASCGCGYVLVNQTRLACTGARDRGICENRLTIARTEVESRVLSAMQNRLFHAEPFEAFCRRLTSRLNELRQQERVLAEADSRELEQVERQIGHLVDSLKNGIPASVVRDQIVALEQRRSELGGRPIPTPVILLHPNMAEVYSTKVHGLREALSEPAGRTRAADLLRGFVDEIRLTPQGSELGITVKGNLAGVLAAAGLPRVDSSGCGGGI